MSGWVGRQETVKILMGHVITYISRSGRLAGCNKLEQMFFALQSGHVLAVMGHKFERQFWSYGYIVLLCQRPFHQPVIDDET